MRLLYARRAHMSNIRHVGRNILKGTSAAWSDWEEATGSTKTVWITMESRTDLLAEAISYYLFHIELEFKDVEVLSEDAYWNVRFRRTRISDGGNNYFAVISQHFSFATGVYESDTRLNMFTRSDTQQLAAFINLVGVKCKIRWRCAKLEVGREYTGYRP